MISSHMAQAGISRAKTSGSLRYASRGHDEKCQLACPSARASGTHTPSSPPHYLRGLHLPLPFSNESIHCNRVCSTHTHKTMSAKSTPAKAAAPNDQRPAKQSGAKNAYLLAYNAASAALWAGVLYQTVTIGAN